MSDTCTSPAGVACLDSDILGVGILVTLAVTFVCSVLTIVLERLNDVHATLSVSGLAFAYAVATVVAKVKLQAGEITDLDVCVAALLGSLLSIWSSAISFSAHNLSVWAITLNLLIAAAVTYTSYGANTDKITSTGITDLAIRSKFCATLALVLAILVSLYTYFWMAEERDKSGHVERRTKNVDKWMVGASISTLVVSTIVALTVGLVINKDGKRAAGISTDFSYGQAYAIAAAVTLFVGLYLQYISEYTSWGKKLEAEVGEGDDDAEKPPDHQAVHLGYGNADHYQERKHS